MTDQPRLIEHAFPLKQASLDSVHEKNVRHGHISTLHIWPARRPLAACRAALIATLLPDPGTPEKRRELCEKIGGTIVKKIKRKKMPGSSAVDREVEETEGGILHWGRETENKETLDWFRNEIRKAYNGRTPKVLDPFAGGGAIPLEAMRLGCEATAVDINPVAWFILKCTLEYPQKLAGKTLPLPVFILDNEEFMNAFYKANKHLVGRTKPTKKQLAAQKDTFDETKTHRTDNTRAPQADLAWHVRAWGQWVLDHARKELAEFYPTYADFEPTNLKNPNSYEKKPMKLVPIKEDGKADIDKLNKAFSKEYLDDKRNPRWVAKPTVAYLWARTVTCKNCRATIPLLKTRWLCKKDNKRVLLTMMPNKAKDGVVFGIDPKVPSKGGNAARKREHDKRISAGTMSRSGAKCPCCPASMTMEDIRIEGKSGKLGSLMTAVVVDGQDGKEYRRPTELELQKAADAENCLEELFAQIPFGLPEEPTPKGGSGASRAFSVDGYGFDKWRKLFTPRQLLAIGTFVKWTREIHGKSDNIMTEATQWMLGCVLNRAINYLSTICIWAIGASEIKQTFLRFALPITWDYAEGNPLSSVDRFFRGGVSNVARFLDGNMTLSEGMPTPHVINGSAISSHVKNVDVIVTDPPYYDAIPYSDLMDFFYIWLRRIFADRLPNDNNPFCAVLSPKWDHTKADGELIDDASRHNNDKNLSKRVYEEGMTKAFESCQKALTDDGRLVIVFAHKNPDAWETLASAIIRAGFVVGGSWPITTEMQGGVRNSGRASLASSIWLVCKKRPETAKAGWDNVVLAEMRKKIREQLREFWDAGIRGPDFVWAATGPAMEAFSKHPVVKKANESGIMSITEFLEQVRRIVVDFVVGRVLSGNQDEGDEAASEKLDEPTAYYLLHRHDFGMDDAPAGACILYALSCGVSDRELAQTWNLIGFSAGKSTDDEEDDADSDENTASDSGNRVKLKTWAQRKSKTLGFETPSGRPIPLIDRVHCLMHIWREGDLSQVDGYLDENGLRRQELFKRLLQSLIELSPHGSDERSLLESISNHVGARGAKKKDGAVLF